MIDSHAHLEFFKEEERIAILERCKEEGVKAIVDSISEYRKKHVWKSWNILSPYFGYVYPTLGFHPNEARRGNWEKVKKVEEFILKHRDEILAVGEIGLDFHYAKSEKERENQRAIFEHFLDLAVEFNLPVVIHARKSEREAYELVQKKGVLGIFHSYAGDVNLAKEILENGHYIGINTGIVFIPEVYEVAEAVELNNILVETDAPYMSPVKGEKNIPCYVRVAIEKIAKLKGISFEEAEEITERNTIKAFNLKI